VLFWHRYHYDERVIDSAYWVVITALTVGYGDIHPEDTVGYWIGFFYIALVVISNVQLQMQ
jgi:hypothetical protein